MLSAKSDGNLLTFKVSQKKTFGLLFVDTVYKIKSFKKTMTAVITPERRVSIFVLFSR